MKKSLMLMLFTALFLSACSENLSSTEQLMVNAKKVNIHNVEELQQLFKKLHYTNADWQKGVKEVPRLTFSRVGPHWDKTSANMPVENKKSIFLRLMLPIILISNEKILHERKIVKNAELTSPELKQLALKYKVITKEEEVLTSAHQSLLLKRVNIIPPSLALAQAAKESGWGTSRFAREGNAFFGQWDFSNNGMKPKDQRKALGTYSVAKFDSPLASVEGYMININTAPAYRSLRDLRAKQVAQNKKFSGELLAGTLIKYSERGEVYVTEIRSLISYNKLAFADNATLANSKLVSIIYK